MSKIDWKAVAATARFTEHSKLGTSRADFVLPRAFYQALYGLPDKKRMVAVMGDHGKYLIPPTNRWDCICGRLFDGVAEIDLPREAEKIIKDLTVGVYIWPDSIQMLVVTIRD